MKKLFESTISFLVWKVFRMKDFSLKMPVKTDDSRSYIILTHNGYVGLITRTYEGWFTTPLITEEGEIL